MRTKDMFCCWAGVALAAVPSLVASPIYVGYGEGTNVEVAADATAVQTDRVTVSADGRLCKTGTGTWTLPTAVLAQPEPLAVRVREGRLAIPSTGYDAPAVPDAPTDVLSTAALWFTSAKNVATTNGEDGTVYVTKWFDARETATNSPSYFWGLSSWGTASAEKTKAGYGVPATLLTDEDGRTGVYFGGFLSSKCMYFQNPAGGNKDITSIANVFLVTGIKQTYGYTLSCNSGTPDFHIGAYTGSNTNAPYWNGYSGDACAMHSGARTWIDGVLTDGFVVFPKAKTQLLEVALPSYRAHAANFFNDRNIANRAGGDFIYEALIFTNVLSEVDRLRVEAYLLDTWNLRTASAATTVRTAAGATVELTAESGSAVENQAVMAGEGVVEKKGAGSLRLTAALDEDYLGTVRVVEGTAALGGVAALQVAAGDVVTVADGPQGDAVTRASNGAAGTVVKRGDGTMRLVSIPSDVKNLSAEAGTLVLGVTPTNGATLVPGSASAVTIANASFEENAPTAGKTDFVGTTRNGWTAAYTTNAWDNTVAGGDRTVFLYNYDAFTSPYGKWPCDYPSPSGAIALAIKGSCQVQTTVEIPVAGVYELSFWTSARYADKVNAFDVLIGPSVDNLTAFGFVRQLKAPYAKRVYRTPELAAGSYVLMLRAQDSNVDGCTTFDDFRLTLLPDRAPQVWTIPNGDFESVSACSGNFGAATNTVRNWTFDAQGTWSDQTYGCVGLATAGMKVYTGSALFNAGEGDHGGSALAVFATGGVARTTFTPPAGTYKLRCKARKWSGKWNTSVDIRGTPQLMANVTVGTAARRSLGSVWPSSFIFKTATFGTPFRVAEGESVILEVLNNGSAGAVIVDDFELVRDVNFITNGGFDSGSTGWTLDSNKNDTNLKNSSAFIQDATSSFSLYHYPGGTVNGIYRLSLLEIGCARQNVTFLSAGLYRLRAYVMSRRPPYSGSYGENPVRFWLAQGAVTNTILATEVHGASNWVEKVVLFNVPAAGTYTFGIQGMMSNPNNVSDEADRMSFVDDVSICPADVSTPATPGLAKDLRLTVAEGAALRLDFSGTNEVYSVRLAGVARSGVIDAAAYPDLVSGPGALFVQPKGTILLFR